MSIVDLLQIVYIYRVFSRQVPLLQIFHYQKFQTRLSSLYE